MSNTGKPLFFYQFLGAHSLLIGLLPFFLPVYLWTHGLKLAGLSVLIGFSGLAFCAALGFWQFVAHKCSIRRLIGITFILEIALIGIVGLFTEIPGAALYEAFAHSAATETETASRSIIIAALCIGAANGFYNAFFWTTQRTLFLKQLGQNDTGRQYGNLQIFVSVFLKLGILIGGFLLDQGGLLWLLSISAIASALAFGYLARACKPDETLLQDMQRVTLLQSVQFKDQSGSRSMFGIDGIFLYLESHFWTLSLFLVVRQDFSRLGFAVVLLAIVFALIFYVVKNRIDQMPAAIVFKVSVWLYAASWIMRYGLTERWDGAGLLIILIMITFCSSFFRLAFNKLFFDVACRTQSVQYLLLKSYVSQGAMGIFFLMLGIILFTLSVDAHAKLSMVYAAAAVLSLVYLKYAKASL